MSIKPPPCDLIFVLAGNLARVEYGMKLFQEGNSPRIILSIGRFDWRRFCTFGKEIGDMLIPLVYRTAPKNRHFFIDIYENEVNISLIKKKRFGTWTEAEALSQYLGTASWDLKIMIISDDFHLKRSLMIIRYFMKSKRILLHPVAIPQTKNMLPSDHKHMTTRKSFWRIIEPVKHFCYWLKMLIYQIQLLVTQQERLVITTERHNFHNKVKEQF